MTKRPENEPFTEDSVQDDVKSCYTAAESQKIIEWVATLEDENRLLGHRISTRDGVTVHSVRWIKD